MHTMRGGFRFLFCGFLLVLLDVTITGAAVRFDLLPDWLGYLLLLVSLDVLAGFERSFRRAQYFAGANLLLVLLTPSIPAMLDFVAKVFLVEPLAGGRTMPAELVDLPRTLLMVPLTWLICGGIASLARFDGQAQLARLALSRRWGVALVLLAGLPQPDRSAPPVPMLNLDLRLPFAGELLLIPAALLVALVLAVLALVVLLYLLFLGLLWRSGGLLGHLNAAPIRIISPAARVRAHRRLRLLRAAELALVLLVLGWTFQLTFLGRPPQPRQLASKPIDGRTAHHGQTMHLSSDGTLLAVVVSSQVRIVDSATLKTIRLIAPQDDRLMGVRFSPDGQRVAIMGRTVTLWDVASGRQLASYDSHPFKANSIGEFAEGLAFSPDGARLGIVDAWTGTVSLHDARTGKLLSLLPSDEQRAAGLTVRAHSLDWSPDGALIATVVSGGAVVIWDVESGALVRRIESGLRKVHDVAFSPNGRSVAAACDDNWALVWDVESGERQRAILLSSPLDSMLGRRPHASPHNWAAGLAWSPDGRLLAAGSSDASAGIWEVASGRQVYDLNGHSDDVGTLLFSPDGRLVLTASFDQRMRVWELAPLD